MKIIDIEEFSKNIIGQVKFNYSIKKLNWFNIGGKTKIYFSPETLNELISFLDIKKRITVGEGPRGFGNFIGPNLFK